MASPFLDAFNAALPDLEASFTEDWIFKGTPYPAIAIDHEAGTIKAMKGGGFEDVTTTVYVRNEVFTTSGIDLGDVITVRGQDFAVLAFEQEGDECKALVLGSPQIDVWK